MSQRLLIGFTLAVVLLAGCGAFVDGGATLVPILATVSLLIAGCAQSRGRDADDGGIRADLGGDAGGAWESCCESGHVSSCFCAAGWACNYGQYCTNEDGSCEYGARGAGGFCQHPDAGHDAGTDAGASLEPCCEDGVVTSCYCPAEWECNYGQFCVDESGACHVGFAPFGGLCEMGDAGRDAGPSP
jgi:hypothetical protein